MQKNKQIFIASILLFLYFCAMIVVNNFKIDGVIVGVFRELLTIPAFILLIALMVLSMIAFAKQQFKPNGFPFYTLAMNLLTIILIIVFAYY
jgi:cytochrome bd-type quinol oxidase subunit 2